MKFDILVLPFLISLSNGLRILFILPCYGGHFGTMSPLIASLSYNNDVTVIATSPTCRNKVASLQKYASFEVIEKDIAWGDVQVGGVLDAVYFFAKTIGETFRAQFNFLKEFLVENRENFDVMITDFTLEGSLVAAEVADIPTAVVMPGTPGAVEYVVDKMDTPLYSVIISQIIGPVLWRLLLSIRSEHNLPALVSQNFIYTAEYPARFPSLVAGSPLMYPELHSSIHYVFIGGLRNESHHDNLQPQLQEWLDLDGKKVIYISLGTVFKISGSDLEDWVDKIRNQDEFRFIWFMNNDMKKSVADLSLHTDSTLYLSEFLPQFKLLGHEQVKVFVTHGGLGSVTDVIKQRKPAVCAPQLFDQPYNCAKLQSLGAGVVSTLEFDAIMEALRKIFSDYDHYVTNVTRLAENYESYEKRELIEKFLLDVAAKGKADVIQDFGFELCSAKYRTVWMVFQIVAIATLLIVLFCITKSCKCLFRTCRKSSKKISSVKPKLS